MSAHHARLDDAQRALFRGLIEQFGRDLQTLPDKPEETAASTAAALWQLAAGAACSAERALELPLTPLDAAGQAALAELVAQRIAGVPLAHLTGRQRFMGLEMLAGPGALIPRRETELLANTAITLLRRLGPEAAPCVIDVCTGCANVAAAIAAQVPSAQVRAADLSAEAVELARANVAHLGLHARVTLAVGDLLAPFDAPALHGRVDVLTCNPPYISAARRATMATEIAAHEPSLAFDGGALGVRILQRLIREAPAFLRPGGWLVFEVGAGQGPAVAQRLAAAGHYDDIEGLVNEAGEVRVLRAQRKAA